MVAVETLRGAMYLIFSVIAIVISAKFILHLCAYLKGKHCQHHYDYDFDMKEHDTKSVFLSPEKTFNDTLHKKALSH